MTPLSDDDIRAMVEAGSVGDAVEAIVARYGAGIYGYIRRVVGDDATAADGFQVFSVRLWQSVEGFRWEGSLKGWLYVIARNAAYRGLEDPFRKRGERLGTQEEAALAARWTRTATQQWQRTEEKGRLWEAVATLPTQDQELLVLRLGRGLSWKEIATVFVERDEGSEPASGGDARAEASRLRKRFERLKGRLRGVMSPSGE